MERSERTAGEKKSCHRSIAAKFERYATAGSDSLKGLLQKCDSASNLSQIRNGVELQGCQARI